MRSFPRRGGACVVALLTVLQFGCKDPENALQRGDRFWADSNYTAALAEYRLALRRRPTDPTVQVRVAHAYAATGQLQPARLAYDRLLQTNREFADQAIFDYLTLAQSALERGDRFGMATAIEAATAIQPGLPLRRFAAPLARYYAATGDAERALAFFERALATQPSDSAADLVMSIATIHEGQGNCAEAAAFYEQFLLLAARGARADEARTRLGTCRFQLARAAREQGRLEEAVTQADAVIQLGVPENIQDQAWFERGEALLALNRRDEALLSFQRVLELNPLRQGQLVERAQRRVDEIRFGPVLQ